MSLVTKQGVRFIVEMALSVTGSGDSLWDTALWDTGTWGGGEPTWIDVTNYTLDVNVTSGVQFFDDQWRTGQAVFTMDNQAGWFNPDSGAVLPGQLDIRPGRWVRLRVEIEGATSDTPVEFPIADGTQWTSDVGGQWTMNGNDVALWNTVPFAYDKILWQGYIDSLREGYPNGASDSVTELVCFDFFGLMAFDLQPAVAPVGAGELSGTRMNRILDAFQSWQWRDIDPGQHTLDATTLDKNLHIHSLETAISEGGAFFFEDRTAVFRPFSWLQGGPTGVEYPRTTTVQMQPGSGLDGQPVLLDAVALWSGQFIRNDIQVSTPGGLSYRTESSLSQSLYGRRTWTQSSYINSSQNQLQDIADRLLLGFQYDYQRVQSITVQGLTPESAARVFDTRFGDLVDATIPLTLRGWGYTERAHVFGIDWNITADDWTAVLRLDSSTRQAPGDVSAYSDGYSDGWL